MKKIETEEEILENIASKADNDFDNENYEAGFFAPEDIIEDVKTWSKIEINALKIVIFTTGLIAGWLIASGDLLFALIVIAVSIYFSVTQSGGTIINYFIEKITSLFKDSDDKINS